MTTSIETVLKHFERYDKVLFDVMKRVDYEKWFEDKYDLDDHKYFHALCRAIIGQQLSGKAARTIYDRFALSLAGKVTPKSILKKSDQSLRDVGLSWAKVSYIKDLANKVEEKAIHLTKLDKMTEQGVIEELIKVKGIGPWTAEMFLMFTLKRENVFSFGDLGLRKGITKVYGIENPSKLQIDGIIHLWNPYKTYGSIALWESLE